MLEVPDAGHRQGYFEQSHTTPYSICKEYLNHPLGLTLSTPSLVIFTFLSAEKANKGREQEEEKGYKALTTRLERLWYSRTSKKDLYRTRKAGRENKNKIWNKSTAKICL